MAVDAYPYRLDLTAEEYRTLAWMEARGYSADLIRHAAVMESGEDDDAPVTLRYRESDAWEVHRKAHTVHCRHCGDYLDWEGRSVNARACEGREAEGHELDEGGELDDDFAACATPTLAGKLRAFIGGIV